MMPWSRNFIIHNKNTNSSNAILTFSQDEIVFSTALTGTIFK